jgi:hypothetical protein
MWRDMNSLVVAGCEDESSYTPLLERHQALKDAGKDDEMEADTIAAGSSRPSKKSKGSKGTGVLAKVEQT